ncbi:MAG: LysR family transcriptional regulator [Gammaproteobacteria bacterium]|nr:LysR family transcriptional regulator [Gammaproteobacteria bacterium]
MSIKNLQLNWLRTFEAVGRHLSFSNAATQLNMSQSAVSQQIRLLEHKLGKKLFLRGHRSVELTVAGLAYLSLVREALQHIERGMESIFNSVAQGVLELSVSNSIAQLWLAPRLKRFATLYPQVSLRMYGRIWDAAGPASTAELEIRYGKGQWTGFEMTELLTGGLRPYCSPTLVDDVRAGRLLTLPLIDVLGTPVGWNEWIAQHGANDMTSVQRLYVDNYAIAADMAAHNVGVCLINDQLVQGSHLHHVLVAPLDNSIDDQANFYLLQPKDKSISAAARAFSGWIKNELTHTSTAATLSIPQLRLRHNVRRSNILPRRSRRSTTSKN